MQRINDVYMYNDSRYRILDFVEDGYLWINIDLNTGFPEQISEPDFESAILSETLKKIDDPYLQLYNKLPEPGSIAVETRDNRMAIIKDLISTSDIYSRKKRGSLVTKVSEETGAIPKTIYAFLRQYWQRGCTPNALLPDYDKSGGRGKKRSNAEKKLGRPRSIAPGTGVIIDASIEKMFRIALDQHYFTEKKHSLPYAHRRFADMYETAYPKIKKSDYPTITQLRYFYERDYAQADRIRRRANKIEYNKDIRPLHSTATADVHGPGARYEIDATIADIYLLSSDRQKIIGRPTLYVVVDVFSRLITGFYVGLENPSYATAIIALYNAMTDKTELCKSVDLEYEEWPSIGLPDAILADRGELLSNQIEYLEQAFNVRIETTGSYRGDAKGIVERTFRTLQADFKPFAPGVVTGTKIKKRGGEDYVLDATLTVSDFTEIIINSIILRNNYSVLEKYDRDPDMPTDVPSVPLEIWKWGIQHRSGRLRSVPDEALKLALLPRQKVTLSDFGIRCFGAFYSCSELIKPGWLHRDGKKRPGPFQAAYDPASADKIYFFPNPHNNDYWECVLHDHSRAYRGLSMWEMRGRIKQQKKTNAVAKVDADEAKRRGDKKVTAVIRRAEKLLPPTFGETKKERKSGIRTNRQEELEVERKKNKLFPKSEKTVKSTAEIIPFRKQEDCNDAEEDASYPDLIDELFGEDE